MPASTARRLPLHDDLSFEARLRAEGLAPLRRARTTTVQVNLGKRCNMACLHCHVEAGPLRTEVMTRATAERVMELVAASPSIDAVDLTGGAPELSPSFRWLVTEARRLGRAVIDRCNLSVLLEPGMEDLPAFLAAHEVRIVASLPCYSRDNVDGQRGKGAFDASVEALRRLNAIGYGRAGSRLVLDLVYNPSGPFLPPPQARLEARYREELRRELDLEFTHLLTLTNMPIARFAHALDRDGASERYERLLVEAFNPSTVPAVMCRTLVSIGWDGALHDCDFHQMLELPLGAGPRTVWDLASFEPLAGQPVRTASHCFGCTAGAGSSCSGSLSE